MAKIIEVEGASKKYCPDLKSSLRYGVKDIVRGLVSGGNATSSTLRRGEFWGLHDVSFDVEPGECVGLIGPNGAGKSTLIKLMMGRLMLSQGRITTRGRVVGLTGFGLGFNPVLTGRENVYVNAAILGMARAETDAVIGDIIEFAGIGDFIEAPVQCYSSGMTARLGYAVAAHVNADILLIDEALSAGDVLFRKKSRNHIRNFIEKGGAAVFVSHDLASVQFLSNRCLVLQKGKLTFEGKPEDAIMHFVSSTGARKESEQEQEEREQAQGGEQPQNPDQAAVNTKLLEDDGRLQDADGKLRTPVRIKSVEVARATGGSMQTGVPVRIVASYESPVDTTAAWGFVILTPDLETEVATEMTETEDFVQIKQGGGELSCTLPQVTLRPGNYAIRVAIVDAPTGVPLALHGFEEAPVNFTIDASAATTANAVRASYHKPLVAMDVAWS